MSNNRQTGKAWERWFINNGLKETFPNVRRNAGTQAQSGGVDLENTRGFNFEVKGGKQCQIKKIRKWIDQAKEEGKPEYFDVVLAKPAREEAFVVMPYPDFLEIINLMKVEEIL